MVDGLDSRTLVPRLVDLLRARIVSGELKPGAKIGQEEFAEAFGVSRTPLREAFRLLEAEGWLIAKPRAGVEVARFSVEEITEISVMRLLMEPLATRTAAVRHAPVEAERLRSMCTSSTPAARESSGAMLDIDRATRSLHFCIYGIPDDHESPNPLHQEVQQYWDRYARYRRVYYDNQSNIQNSNEEHAAIVEAWCGRAGELAEHLMAQHIFRAALRIISALDPHAEISDELVELAHRYDFQIPQTGAPLT